MSEWLILLLIIAGLGIGALGTFVGVGGGVFMMPILLLLLGMSPALAAGTSLAAIFVNSTSGTIAYARQRRIDFNLGYKFALATIPGVIIGSFLIIYFNDRLYIGTFAVVVCIIAAALLFQKGRTETEKRAKESAQDRTSMLFKGLALSLLAGFLASIFGIGGGIIHVPFLILLLGFTAHRATATSHFMLMITSFVGAATAGFMGNVDLAVAACLGIGLAIGAQLGAHYSARSRPVIIVRVLALILVIVAIRLFVKALLGF